MSKDRPKREVKKPKKQKQYSVNNYKLHIYNNYAKIIVLF